jgi:hypothetical protein
MKRAIRVKTGLAVTLHTAMNSSSLMEELNHKMEASVARLRAIEGLLPAENKNLLAAGPIDERGWCIVVSTPAMSSRIRQMLPLISKHLSLIGLPTPIIRIHIRRE